MYKISKQALAIMRKSVAGKVKLQIALTKSAPTIQRYLDNNDIMLTTKAGLEAIKETTDLAENKIWVKE